MNQPLVALRYMQRALRSDLENQAPLAHIASTKLNICAVLSSLKRHVEARKFAQESVEHVFGTIRDIENPQTRHQYINVDRESLFNTVTIALFNLAAEHEHLNELQEALKTYNLAQEFVKKSNIATLDKLIGQAIQNLEERLAELGGSLTKRSVMREAKAASRLFNDQEHIREIDRKQRTRQAISDTRA